MGGRGAERGGRGQWGGGLWQVVLMHFPILRPIRRDAEVVDVRWAGRLLSGRTIVADLTGSGEQARWGG